MADDRPADTATDQLATLQSAFDDFRSTLLARVARCPTGDIEPTIRTTAKPDTLLMQGQAVNRADYPVLWQWVQDQSLVTTGLFTSGNGTTTFGLPDFRGRVVRGVAASEAVGLLSGADTKAIATTNLPGHTHSIGDDGQHQHNFLTAQDGDHGGHFPGTSFTAAAGADYGLSAWNSSGNNSGTHNHSGTTAYNSQHNHGTATGSTGSGTAFDVRQASINVNWLIWT